MTGRWAGSDRRAHLPHNWDALRAVVRARANDQCEWQTEGVRCDAVGTECDHTADRDNHHPNALQWLCQPHHAIKTQAEAQAAAAAVRAKLRPPARPHPGLLDSTAAAGDRQPSD